VIKLKILFATGEVYPFSKTGGLADLSKALPKALLKLGHEVYIITPLYQSAKQHLNQMNHLGQVNIKMGQYVKACDFYQLEESSIQHIFVRHDAFYDRMKLYLYDDDVMRFTFFNFAILESLKFLPFTPDIIHLNDWQTALVPYLLDAHYKMYQSKIRTLFTIHNLEKQGAYPLEHEKLFNDKNYTYVHMGKLNFLKAGIMRATAINTVSEHYRNEILLRFYAFDLDGPLKARERQLYGILSGFDNDLYDPSLSKNLMINYDFDTAMQGKKVNKDAFLTQFNLKNDSKPLVIYIGRLARQKGMDLLMQVIEPYLEKDLFNFAVVGKGEPMYEVFFQDLANQYDNAIFIRGFDNSTIELCYAAGDLFLMPSLFEPLGLNHLIAMRYGALPLVRETGGLKDTVTNYNKHTGIGVGFTFKNYDKEELNACLDFALNLYKTNLNDWQRLVKQAMQINHNFVLMAKDYEKLYLNILNQNI
jgi:starch synthase